MSAQQCIRTVHVMAALAAPYKTFCRCERMIIHLYSTEGCCDRENGQAECIEQLQPPAQSTDTEKAMHEITMANRMTSMYLGWYPAQYTLL